MKNKLQEYYETRLETAEGQNIVPILDAKLEATSANRVTDYVSYALDALDYQIKMYKDSKKDLDMMIKLAETQKAIVKTGVSLWLVESGIESLDGDIVSSMKMTQPKAKEELIVTDKEALINQGYFTQQLDKTAVKQAILDGVEVEGAEIEVVHQEGSLTIYKKRAKSADNS